MEFVCFVRASEQTANCALHNIKRSVFITDRGGECLVRGTHSHVTQIRFFFKRLISKSSNVYTLGDYVTLIVHIGKDHTYLNLCLCECVYLCILPSYLSWNC